MEFSVPPTDPAWPRDFSNVGEPAGNPVFDDWLLSYMTETLSQTQPVLQSADVVRQGFPEIPAAEFDSQPPLDVDMGSAPEFPQEWVSSTSGSAEQGTEGATAVPLAPHSEEDKAAQRAAKVAEKNRRAQKRFREREKMKKATLEIQVAELSAKLSTVMAEKTRLENRNSILEKVVKLKDEYITDLEAKAPQEDIPSVQQSLNTVLCDFSEVVKSGKCAKYKGQGDIPLSAIQSTHKAYIDELARCLMEGAEDPAKPAHARMLDLIAAMRVVMARMAQLNDKLFLTVYSQQVLPGDRPSGRADLRHWHTVLDAVALSGPQKDAVLAARNELLSRMAAIVAERERLVAGLQEKGGTVEGEDYLKQFENRTAIEKLQNNLKAEYRAVCDFDVAFFQTILTPLQQARMQVASYPWPTESMAICSLIAEDMGGAKPGAAGQQPMDYASLLSGLSEKSPFRALAAPLAV